MSQSDRKLLIIGAGGHASVVIDVARAAGFDPVIALDPHSRDAECNGVKVAGGDDLASRFLAEGIRQAVVALGDNKLRARLGDTLADLGFTLPTIKHPTAVISPSARLGEGTVVMPLAVINARAEVGRMVIVNTSAVIEHDCTVSDGAHVAPGSVLGGNVKIGNCVLIGIGTIIRPGASVADFATVGAGATVISDIGSNEVAVGSPAKVRRA
jgi:UDP-perosamine 4-acetyltransferase